MAEAVEIIEDDPIEVRRAKREALIAAGVDPYGHSVKRSHSVGELNEKYAHLEDGESTEDEVLIAGRVMAKRVQGKIAFLELRESGCDIQLFCRINALGEEAFAALCDLDVGDWIAVHGTMMRTKRGQLSVAVDSFELMSKSLRPLPEKFHGLTDKETRYRQRYVDLVMNPEVRTTFERRFKIVSAIRRYMEGQGYYEVETPFLHAIIGGANAKPFITHFNALDRDYYLRIATELPLKRLLVGGFEKVFEIGRQFRNEGMDPYHNPEFTTMEAYEAFGDLDSMMDLTEGCIKAAAEAACGTLKIEYQGTPVDLSGDWRRASMMELASEHAGEEVSFDRTRDELVAILEKNGGHAEAAWGKGKLISEIFEAVAEEKLIQPTFVVDHPLEISPLAKKHPENPELTQRFELFILGHEYGNAFTELNDPVDQAERFRAQVAAKDMGDDEAVIAMVDSNLQREAILPSERAFAYSMRLEAMKRPGQSLRVGQRTDLTCAQLAHKSDGRRSRDILAEELGVSKDKVQRFIRLTHLIPELLALVDEGRMKMLPAVEVSYLSREEQTWLYDAMGAQACTPSHAQGVKMKRYSKEGSLTGALVRSIMEEEKPNQVEQFKIPRKSIARFFRPSATKDEIESRIVRALELLEQAEARRGRQGGA